MEIKIDDEFWFGAKENLSINLINKGLLVYSDNKDQEQKLENDTPIFVDTNVLTHYYKISFSEREKLRSKLEKYKDRIIITRQVEKEFIKNRTSIIRQFNGKLKESLIDKFNVLKKSILDLNKGNIKGIKEYVNDKVIKNDIPGLSERMSQIYDDLKKSITQAIKDTNIVERLTHEEDKVKGIIESATKENNAHEKNDKILDLLSNFKVCDNLSIEEILFLKEKYIKLNTKYQEVKSNDKVSWQYVFPGCGEKKDKSDPTGDFIIYHEILKYMKVNECNAVFLTNDIGKKDWLNLEKEQYTHYIESAYSNTNQMMYIFHAQDVLEVSYKNVFEEKSNSESRSDLRPSRRIEWNKEKQTLYEFLKIDKHEPPTESELVILYAMADNQDFAYEPINAWAVNQDLKKIGFRTITINLLTKSLINKKFIEIIENEDYNGNIILNYQFTKKGEDYLMQNFDEEDAKEKLKIPKQNPKDNLPF